MDDDQGRPAGGLLAALKNIAATLLTSGKTRLELLANEIEVEKLRALRLLLMAGGVLFCFGFGVILLTALLVALFWEQHLLLLGLLSVLFLVLGAFFLVRMNREKQRPDKMFAASLAELQEDLRQLKAMVDHEPHR